MADEKSELEEEYDDDEAGLEGVDPEDDVIEDVEDGEIFDDDDEEDFEEDASLEEVAESEEDDEDDEVEADLSAILQERIAADDDEEEEEESSEAKDKSGESPDTEEPVSAKDDEVLCQSCFTLVSQKAIDAEGACPNCGAEM